MEQTNIVSIPCNYGCFSFRLSENVLVERLEMQPTGVRMLTHGSLVKWPKCSVEEPDLELPFIGISAQLCDCFEAWAR